MGQRWGGEGTAYQSSAITQIKIGQIKKSAYKHQ